MLWMIHQWYRIASSAGQLYDLADLTKVTCLRGKSRLTLSSFLYNWNRILDGMKTQPNEETKLIIFAPNIKQYTDEIKHDNDIFDRAKDSGPQESYQFLHDAAKAYIMRIREESNRAAIQKKLSGSEYASAHFVLEKGKGKGKGDRGRTPSRDRRWEDRSNNDNYPSPQQAAKGFTKGGKGKGRSQSKGRGRSPSKGKGKGKSRGRSDSPGKGKGKGKSRPFSRGRSPSKGKGKGNFEKKPCPFFAKGICNRGKDCWNVHDPQNVQATPAAAAGNTPKPKKKRNKSKSGTPAIVSGTPAIIIAAVASFLSGAEGFIVPGNHSSSIMIENNMLHNQSQDLACEAAVTGAIRFNENPEVIEFPVGTKCGNTVNVAAQPKGESLEWKKLSTW